MKQVWLNGVFAAEDEARISPLSEGFLFGRGVFETVRVMGGRPVFFQDHMARMREAMFRLGIAPAPEFIEAFGRRLEENALRLLEVNAVERGSIKVVAYAERGGVGELILTRENAYPDEQYARGFSLVSDHRGRGPAPLAAAKTLNYLGNILAKRGAQTRGADEPLFVDSSAFVLEGATTNIFAAKGEALVTPPLASGILPGIARAKVMSLVGAKEEPLSLAQLLAADEVFVTNALLGVMPVACCDERIYSLADNPVTRRARQAYETAVWASVQGNRNG
jgi:branched-subunit amino acid aminotransferase/4-amino-4-deoxychorismate lyase